MIDRMTDINRNLQWLTDQGLVCMGDGETSCIQCGEALDLGDAEELRQGMCVLHLREAS